jgi:hypothetical protein
MERECPKCGVTLTAQATYCGCGWRQRKGNPKASSEDSVAPIPDCCEYTNGFKRCRYPAVFSPSTRGGGPWYCRFHARRVDSTRAAQIVDESQEFVAEAGVDQQFEREVQQSLKANGLQRRPNESTADWHARMREFCLQKIANIKRRMAA